VEIIDSLPNGGGLWLRNSERLMDYSDETQNATVLTIADSAAKQLPEIERVLPNKSTL